MHYIHYHSSLIVAYSRSSPDLKLFACVFFSVLLMPDKLLDDLCSQFQVVFMSHILGFIDFVGQIQKF